MIPEDRFYTRDHLWVRPEEAQVELGVTEPFLLKLGNIISIELLDADDEMKEELPFGELECTSETVQLYPPLEARITEVNDELIWRHDKILNDPYGEGWLLRARMEDQRELRQLMTASRYVEFCKEDLGEEWLDD
jgi:glycine cleavage system H protein